jgi:hypothetical protein
VTKEAQYDGINWKTTEDREDSDSSGDSGHGAQLDSGHHPEISPQGADPGLAGLATPLWVATNGSKRIDASRFFGRVAHASPIFQSIPEFVVPRPLPESVQETAIRAWKRVTILDYRSTTPKVISRYSKKPQIAMEPAICVPMWGGYDPDHQGDHVAPDPDCSCGYYGWKERRFEGHQPFGHLGHYATATTAWQPWAEVDFYGQIIEHEYGYRAERQRILAIHLDRKAAAPPRELNLIARAINIPIIDAEGVEHK